MGISDILTDIKVDELFKVKWKTYRKLKCNSKKALATRIIIRYWHLMIQKAIEEGMLLDVYGSSAKLLVGDSFESKQKAWWKYEPMMRMRRIKKPAMWLMYRQRFWWKRRFVIIPSELYTRMFDRAIHEKAYQDQQLFVDDRIA